MRERADSGLDALVERGAAELLSRGLPGGGFAGRPGGPHRPDASAWAIVALAALGPESPALAAARSRLAAEQRDDGRVPAHAEHPAASWPTPVAILAWLGSRHHATARDRAIAFLLESTGRHWPVRADAATAHDTSLRGWPWIDATHSWVEPTALAMLALEAAGHGHHPRVAEARRLLLDRMLPGGGWNYGNTRVFGSTLRPLPESTGVALVALAGRVERERIRPSLDYLEAQLARIRTPFTLGWGLLALGAWARRPADAARRVEETLARSARLGPFDTTHLALLLLGHRGRAGLRAVLPGGSLRGEE